MPDRVKLTATQKRVLQLAITGGRIFYYSEKDATLGALRRRGFAQWVSGLGQKYTRSHWWITDDGVTAGRALLASNAKGE